MSLVCVSTDSEQFSEEEAPLSLSLSLFSHSSYSSSVPVSSSCASMAVSAFGIMAFSLSAFVSLALLGLVSSAKFDELFQPTWALDHFTYEGEQVHMKLDNFSGI